MNTQQHIANINARANKLWLNPDPNIIEDDVVTVCIFTDEHDTFSQAWFAHWNYKGIVTETFGKFIAEGKTIDKALERLDAYLSIHEAESQSLIKDGNRIINKISFGD